MSSVVRIAILNERGSGSDAAEGTYNQELGGLDRGSVVLPACVGRCVKNAGRQSSGYTSALGPVRCVGRLRLEVRWAPESSLRGKGG
jgi:hypothetical protein